MIKEVDPELLARLNKIARVEKRTLGQQILYILERYLVQGPRRDMGTAAQRLRAYWSTVEPAPEFLLPEREPETERQEQIRKILEGEL